MSWSSFYHPKNQRLSKRRATCATHAFATSVIKYLDATRSLAMTFLCPLKKKLTSSTRPLRLPACPLWNLQPQWEVGTGLPASRENKRRWRRREPKMFAARYAGPTVTVMHREFHPKESAPCACSGPKAFDKPIQHQWYHRNVVNLSLSCHER